MLRNHLWKKNWKIVDCQTQVQWKNRHSVHIPNRCYRNPRTVKKLQYLESNCIYPRKSCCAFARKNQSATLWDKHLWMVWSLRCVPGQMPDVPISCKKTRKKYSLPPENRSVEEKSGKKLIWKAYSLSLRYFREWEMKNAKWRMKRKSGLDFRL